MNTIKNKQNVNNLSKGEDFGFALLQNPLL
ncbi:MAG: hypothetical protein JWQ54_3930 [Mucilaginibacter sp.]|nr:hypothetical protein [Mucilaginibacter sp.]